MTVPIERETTADTIIHATAVAIDGHAVLIVGPSGSGKSDLAIRLIDRGAVLIADDRVVCALQDGVMIATCPATIRGLIEIRGVGLVEVDTVGAAPVSLVVRLAATIERHPQRACWTLLGTEVEELAMSAYEGSTPIKVELALRRAVGRS